LHLHFQFNLIRQSHPNEVRSQKSKVNGALNKKDKVSGANLIAKEIKPDKKPSNLTDVVYDDGTDCPKEDLENKIQQKFMEIENFKIFYWLLGLKSNSTAYYVLKNIPELKVPTPPKYNSPG